MEQKKNTLNSYIVLNLNWSAYKRIKTKIQIKWHILRIDVKSGLKLKGNEKNLQQTIENLRKRLVQIRENSSQRKQTVGIIEKAKHESGEAFSYM